jgi:hypothetical protein
MRITPRHFFAIRSYLSSIGVDFTESVLAPVLLDRLSLLSLEGLSVVELVHAVLEVLTSVSTSGLLPRLGAVDGLHGVQHQILQFKGFDQVGVPHHAAIVHLDIVV